MTFEELFLEAASTILPEILHLRKGLKLSAKFGVLALDTPVLRVTVSNKKEEVYCRLSLQLACPMQTSVICQATHEDVWKRISTWKPKTKKAPT